MTTAFVPTARETESDSRYRSPHLLMMMSSMRSSSEFCTAELGNATRMWPHDMNATVVADVVATNSSV